MSSAKERVMQRKEPAKRLTLEQKLDLINHAKNGVKNVDLCVLLREGDFLFAEFCDNRNV
ncbi:hypothetical protein NQ318_021022 [Aromia moschata]|uniref:Uncharacterized protein n=1 Tax=Aromia moschata TaxID=1265417 RepID=A0AAV8YN66_9CUCU|nr:hypothetical protein NQ318_021022 [Aromia moschata]